MTERDYLKLLGSNVSAAMHEWNELASLLTTGESYFFRDSGQFALLRNRILPELVERNRNLRRLRIWSAGCASGEEPYSISILLNELIRSGEGWRILILGSDINRQAIHKAKNGLYTAWSFRQVEPALRDTYFALRKTNWEIDGKIRARVNFTQCNLVSDPFPSRSNEMHDMDLILCRNVFIYFDPETVARVVDKFTETLNDGGYLLTGHGELPRTALKGLRTRLLDNQMIFQKVSGAGAGDLDSVESSGVPEAGISVRKSNEAFPFPKTKTAGIGRAATRGIKPAGKTADPVKPVSSGAVQKKAIVVVPEPEGFGALLLMAGDFANRGEYDRAVLSCREAAAMDIGSPLPYLLLAQIAESTGNNDDAKNYLKKAIYLDTDFAAAYIELGKIYMNEKMGSRAARMISTARELLMGMQADSAVSPYEGITAGELLGHMEELLRSLDDKY